MMSRTDHRESPEQIGGTVRCCEEHLQALAAVPEPEPAAGEWSSPVADAEQRNHRLVLLNELAEHTAWHQAQAMDEADRAQSFRIDAAHTLPAWMAHAANTSKRDTRVALRRGRICHELPDVSEAWRTHRITGAHVDRLAGLAADAPELRDQLERDAEMLIAGGQQLTPEQFAKLCHRWRDLADPDGAYTRWCDRHERRGVRMGHDLDHALLLDVTIDGADGEAVFSAINTKERALFAAEWGEAKARLGREPTVAELPRTTVQRRCDALVELIKVGAAATSSGPAPALVNYVIDHDTFEQTLARMFQTEEARRIIGPEHTRDCLDDLKKSETVDGIAVPPELIIRELLQANVRRVVFGGPSVIIDAGRTRRFFTGPVRDLIRLTQASCRVPACDRPAWRCEIDHLEEVHEGGTTDLANAALECGVHNRAKHRGDLWVKRRSNGRYNWYRRDGTYLGTT